MAKEEGIGLLLGLPADGDSKGSPMAELMDEDYEGSDEAYEETFKANMAMTGLDLDDEQMSSLKSAIESCVENKMRKKG